MADVSGQPAERVSLAMTRYGSARADVVLASGDPPTGAVTLTLADLVMEMTVHDGYLEHADRPILVLVNGAGWERPLATPMSYHSPAGVRLSTVLFDLAARSGETIEQPAEQLLGGRFAALAEPGVLLRDVLGLLQRTGHIEPWRIDPDGVTRFGARSAAEISARASYLGSCWWGIDSPASFLPGRLLEGEVIDQVTFVASAAELKAEIWTQPLEDAA